MFILVGLIYDWGGVIKHPGPGLANFQDNPFANGFAGTAQSFTYAFYSFGGVELVTLAAGETANPQKAIPRAIRGTFARSESSYPANSVDSASLTTFSRSRPLLHSYGSRYRSLHQLPGPHSLHRLRRIRRLCISHHDRLQESWIRSCRSRRQRGSPHSSSLRHKLLLLRLLANASRSRPSRRRTQDLLLGHCEWCSRPSSPVRPSFIPSSTLSQVLILPFTRQRHSRNLLLLVPHGRLGIGTSFHLVDQCDRNSGVGHLVEHRRHLPPIPCRFPRPVQESR